MVEKFFSFLIFIIFTNSIKCLPLFTVFKPSNSISKLSTNLKQMFTDNWPMHFEDQIENSNENLFQTQYNLPSFSKKSQPIDDFTEMSLKKRSQPMENINDLIFDKNGNLVNFDISNFSFNQKRSQPIDDDFEMNLKKKSQPIYDDEFDFVPYKRSMARKMQMETAEKMPLTMIKKSQPIDDFAEMSLKKRSLPIEDFHDFSLKKRSPLQIPEKLNQKNSQPMDDTTPEFSLRK